MFDQLRALAYKITWIAGLFLAFLLGLYLFRNFVFFYRFSPVWGWTFAGVVVVAFVVALVYLWAQFAAYPRVLTPPALPEPGERTHADMAAYTHYLARYMDRLAMNKQLTHEERALATDKANYIYDLFRSHPLNDDLARTIDASEQDVIEPLLGSLRAKAEAEVRQSVRDVMLGVTLSPYPSIDLVIVIYRNFSMVGRVIKIYASRPTAREQYLILRDTFRVVVAVNFLNMGRRLLDGLFSQMPVVGHFVESIGQGLGAGFLTSASGHAALSRCEAFRGWNKEDAVQSLAADSTRFLADVKNMFTKDVLPNLKSRIQSEVPDEKSDVPGFWDSMAQGIGKAVDVTAGTVNDYFVKPTVTGTQKVVAAGSYVARGVSASHRSERRRSTTRRRSRSSGEVSRLGRLFGQRLKYGWRRGPKS